ncbi:hypothetical protein BOW50_09450 [Solemya velum gill symbiont]|uniref:lytic transglycosylase domain-containing protein n=1 Tax=Solemya velum gill symbiont TaxID=2340 RepID=UPI0009C4905C|nr:lytic transglycosylase domain-containing protein [Solemya velum gill symbiont]OOZ76706.1 hypothetical protein BOW50_09450 [Solemya velum gill symbiont]
MLQSGKKTALALIILLLPVGQLLAGTVYVYLAPDGTLAYSDEQLETPYRYLNTIHLNWGDVEGRKPESIADKLDELLADEKVQKKSKKQVSDNRFSNIVNLMAEKYRLPPELIHAVIEAESNYNVTAISRTGATGLMQLMPETAKRLGVSDRTDPKQNIEGGAKYLRELLDRFNNDLALALAGYNAGEHAVLKYGRTVPPYKETQKYVDIVLRNLRRNFTSGDAG